MAQLDNFKKRERTSVANQIAAFGTRLATAARLSNIPVHLAETFEVWKLQPKALTGRGQRLAKVARFTGYWQHVIRHGGEPEEIAWSARENATGKWKVHSIGTTVLARNLGEAIKYLDENDHSDALVRILLVPVFGLHALWLFFKEEDRVVLFEAMRPVPGLTLKKIYSGKDFLSAIAKQAKHLPRVAQLTKPPRKPRPRSPFKRS